MTVRVALLLLCLVIGAPTFAAGPDPAWKIRMLAHKTAVVGTYINEQYCFSIPPFGPPMYRESAPSPNHGAFMVLGKGRFIWAGAISNAAGYQTAVESIDSGPDATRLEEGTVTLSAQPAVQVVFETATETMVSVAQIRSGYIYQLQLTTTRDDFSRDMKTFAKALQAFAICSK